MTVATLAFKIASIRLDGGTQTRAGKDPGTVQDYRAAMLDGATFPPVVIFQDGPNNWLADGFHRVEAATLAGLLEIAGEAHQGTLRDARLYSAGANHTHGLRPTSADKRASVAVLLDDEEWCAWSDREIARRTGVSHTLVAQIRAKRSGNIASPQTETAPTPPPAAFPGPAMAPGPEVDHCPPRMVPGEHGEGPAPLLSAPQCPPAPPAEGELEHLRAENEDLSERLGEMADLMKDTMEENESLQRIMDAENLRLGYQKEVTRFRAHANTCQSHLRGVVNETNAYKRTAKYWMNKCLSLAKTIERADKMHQVDHDDSSFVATVQKTLKKVQKAMDAPPVQDPAPYPHLDEVSALVREPLPEAPDLFAGCEDSEAVDV